MSTFVETEHPRSLPRVGAADDRTAVTSGTARGFDPAEHPRDRVGRFAEKDHTGPEVALAPNPLADRYDTVAEKVKAMQDELARAVEDLADDESWKHYLDTMSRFHGYSFNNQMLIQIQRPGASRVAGYRVWQSLGRQVKKGERGIAILAPRLVNDRDDNGEPILGPNGKPRKKVIGFTSTTVFDISQTEGEPLPERWGELSEEPPEGLVDDLAAAIEARGYEVRFEDMSGQSARGYTSNADGQHVVVIDSSTSPGTQATTLAHELGHIMCGHMDEDRMGEYHTGHGGRRGVMEMEAESFAYVIARANGMQAHIEPASEYVAGWQTKAPEEFRSTGETVQKAVKATLTGSVFRNLLSA